ncbi:putative Arylsulfotransferase [Diplodia seriata]|uniref:Putative Arylsulfotransferase n=1 Tax=Diplodia seriata TaxID=420778 RepID=A0A0G2EM91_9PEZI|nr:putative Arylsulfotransferase [Diplodia seriata]
MMAFTTSSLDAVAPGYWFVAPYNTNNAWEAHQGPLYESCQVGPAIYDNDGELIWSGACLFNNMNAFDFRPIDYGGGKKYLSLNVGRGTPSIYGAGLILSDTYEIVREVQMSAHTTDFNQHEFNVIDDGAAALYVTETSHEVSGAGIGLGDAATLWARSNGVAEESLLWGREETLDFEWDCIDQVPLNESTFPWPEAPDEGRGWDYMHMNSIDKFPGGDYLVSMRYSNSLMRVGSDGRVVWRLGGRASDFAMKDDFTFSRQHHARIVSTNSTTTVVTLLDNAAGSLGSDEDVTAPESSALIIRLHHDDVDATRQSWAAEVLRRYPRPDGAHSYLRGSVQLLLPPGDEEDETSAYPSSLTHIHDRYPGFETAANVLACWSKDGYATEFRPDGGVAAEARFATAHLDTYRAFKYDGFVGRPAAEPPALKAFAFGDVAGQRSAVVDGSGRGVGQTMTVAGFETVLTIPNLPVSHLWVEALDAAGAVLGRSATVAVVVPAAQRPYEPVDVLRPDGEEEGRVGTGDFVFADESEGFIGEQI